MVFTILLLQRHERLRAWRAALTEERRAHWVQDGLLGPMLRWLTPLQYSSLLEEGLVLQGHSESALPGPPSCRSVWGCVSGTQGGGGSGQLTAGPAAATEAT